MISVCPVCGNRDWDNQFPYDVEQPREGIRCSCMVSNRIYNAIQILMSMMVNHGQIKGGFRALWVYPETTALSFMRAKYPGHIDTVSLYKYRVWDENPFPQYTVLDVLRDIQNIGPIYNAVLYLDQINHDRSDPKEILIGLKRCLVQKGQLILSSVWLCQSLDMKYERFDPPRVRSRETGGYPVTARLGITFPNSVVPEHYEFADLPNTPFGNNCYILTV